jgi:hypothetical protein
MDLTAVDFVLLGNAITWVRPLWIVLLTAAAALAGALAIGLMLQLLVPKVVAVARTTAKESMNQPLFAVLMAIGVVALLFFPYIPYNTFGEDVKMLKAEGLTLVKFISILLALWSASVSIAEEIEGRTALTVLSKPIGRSQLILGKFLGILIPVAIMFLVLGTLFLCTVSYKVVYDARESALPEPSSLDCAHEIMLVIPGLVLSFLEVMVMTSISVAISTRLAMLPNLVISVSVYLLGHLVPVLINSSVARFEVVTFFGRLLAAVLPVLDHFGMETAISTGQPVNPMYVAATAGYAVLYCAVAMLLALFLFEDRDLA